MNKLKNLRKENNLTQENLANVVGVSYQAIAHYETGTREMGYEVLVRLANYFNVSIDYLLDHETQKSPSTEAERLTIEQKALLGFWSELTPPVKEKIKNIIIAMFPEYIDKISQIK